MTDFAKRAAVDTGVEPRLLAPEVTAVGGWRVARCEISSRRIYRIQPPIRA